MECKERFGGGWVRCARTAGPETEVSVDDSDVIREGKSYEFRVRAVNKAGEGQPSEPTKQVRGSQVLYSELTEQVSQVK